MYGAFSFGKIIKTILPGSILAATLFAIVEELWFRAYGTSLLVTLVQKEAATVAGAALVPLSLILGFLLNTIVWLNFNRRIRRSVKSELEKTPFAQLRAALCELVQYDVNGKMGQARADACKDTWPDPLALEYYFLPAITVERLAYLWESYFSWYEFQLNTSCALAASGIAVIGVLLHRQPMSPQWTGVLCVSIAVACVALCGMLWRAAVKNMAAYEKNLVLLIAGSVNAAAR